MANTTVFAGVLTAGAEFEVRQEKFVLADLGVARRDILNRLTMAIKQDKDGIADKRLRPSRGYPILGHVGMNATIVETARQGSPTLNITAPGADAELEMQISAIELASLFLVGVEGGKPEDTKIDWKFGYEEALERDGGWSQFFLLANGVTADLLAISPSLDSDLERLTHYVNMCLDKWFDKSVKSEDIQFNRDMARAGFDVQLQSPVATPLFFPLYYLYEPQGILTVRCPSFARSYGKLRIPTPASWTTEFEQLDPPGERAAIELYKNLETYRHVDPDGATSSDVFKAFILRGVGGEAPELKFLSFGSKPQVTVSSDEERYTVGVTLGLSLEVEGIGETLEYAAIPDLEPSRYHRNAILLAQYARPNAAEIAILPIAFPVRTYVEHA